jgi:hypothetical protein
MMSRNIIFVLIYHRHRLLDLINYNRDWLGKHYFLCLATIGSTRLRSWLKNYKYAASRKVEGSSPDVVDFFFNLHNPSSRTMMALGSIQP